MALLKELKIDKKTIIFFTSDNGAAQRFKGVHNSCGKMQGYKRSMYEGGIRVPMIVRWPDKIKAGKTSDLPWYFPDVMPTLAEIAGVSKKVPSNIDGLSVVPTLLSLEGQKQHKYMFWEFNGHRAVRSGNWKGLTTKKGKFSLYDLSNDTSEQNDLSAMKPEITNRLKQYTKEAYHQPRSQKDDGKYTGRPSKKINKK